MDKQTIIDAAVFVVALAPVVLYALMAWMNGKGE